MGCVYSRRHVVVGVSLDVYIAGGCSGGCIMGCVYSRRHVVVGVSWDECIAGGM